MVRAGVPLAERHPLVMIVVAGIQMNVVLAVFNLVPIPPLDGSKVASCGLPGSFGERYDRVMEPYGYLILLLLMMTGLLSYVISPITTWVIFTLFRMARMSRPRILSGMRPTGAAPPGQLPGRARQLGAACRTSTSASSRSWTGTR